MFSTLFYLFHNLGNHHFMFVYIKITNSDQLTSDEIDGSVMRNPFISIKLQCTLLFKVFAGKKIVNNKLSRKTVR